ncbi:hypothetical protein LCGC14_2245590 [marine sediment metagenome]|uniref:NADH:ubiquinone/plastoquinone oxidoreductase chloroplast chain 5 C-terminal domain-containing protein n=1 Tax=marine sediment metagenome TaxID=412755 RepID=A0A0F9D4C7_9ZZZZ
MNLQDPSLLHVSAYINGQWTAADQQQTFPVSNPATGEQEDTDVGFPGPEHHIAERERSMKVPMAILAVLSLLGGLVQVPGVSDVVERFLEPTFAGSRFAGLEPSAGIEGLALVLGGVVALAGIAIAYFLYVRAHGSTLRLVERLRVLHTFLFHKWYFDELYEAVFVQPLLALGRGASQVFERVVIDGMVSGTTLVVRTGNSLLRIAQSGILRSYALLLVGGVAAIVLYFLIVSN